MASYTISPIWGAGAQLFDDNGNPLSGGKIYVYAAGTTTPITTYIDPIGSFANTNPIVANAAGRLNNEIWLPIATAVKFVLKTSTDVLIATYDNIPSAPQPAVVNSASSISYNTNFLASAGTFTVGQTYEIAYVGSTDFTAIGAAANAVGTFFTATGVGAGTGTAYYIRTVEAKLQDILSVKDFGAVGDGVANDTAAIQSAVNYVKATGKHGIVYFPTGIYLTDVINLPWIVSIQGDGIKNTTIKMRDGANGAAVIQTEDFAALDAAANYGTVGAGTKNGSYQISISDLTIDGNKVNNAAGRGIQLYGLAWLIQNVWIVNCKSDGLYTGFNGVTVLNTVDDVFESRVINMSISDNDGSGWIFRGPQDSAAYAVELFKNGGWGLEVKSPLHLEYLNTYLCTLGGIDVAVGANITGSNVIGSTGTGRGARLVGGNHLSASLFGGPIALEILGADNNIQGDINGGTAGAIGLKFSSQDSGGIFNLVMHDVATFIDCTTPPFLFQKSDVTITSNDGPSVTAFAGGIRPNGMTRVYAPGTVNSSEFNGTVLAIGDVAHTWLNGVYGVQTGPSASVWSLSSSLGRFSVNAYTDTSATPRYQNAGFAAEYRVSDGAHVWYTAPSGSADSPISFVSVLECNASGTLLPGSSNGTQNLGSGSNRWGTVFAANGTINTSDAQYKQDITELNDAEKRVATRLKSLVKKFRYKDAVQTKGEAARIHVGVIAQEVQTAFETEGLQAERYGIFCYDQWDAQPAVYEDVIDKDGKVVGRLLVQEAKQAGSQYGVRYEELLAFIIAVL